MKISELANELDKIIPRSLSEPWDNDGAMVIPDEASEVKRVLCALDCTGKTIELAKEKGCNVIITHHPLIFKCPSSVTPSDPVGKRIIECIKNGISVLSYHTRLDSAERGVNDMLASLLGMKNTYAFLPYGRKGEVEEVAFGDFAARTAKALGIDNSKLTLVNSNGRVKNVAIVSGGGKDFIYDAFRAGADTYVTGEVMHNHMIDCRELGMNLICATHYATERFIVNRFAEILDSLGIQSVAYEFDAEAEYGV